MTTGLSRRSLLRAGVLGAAVTALDALSGCSPSGSSTRSSPSSLGPSGPTAEAPSQSSDLGPPTAADWNALGSSLSGTLVLPSSAGFRAASELYNPRFDSLTPAAIAFCANADDVARCVGFSRDHQITPIPRAGGHSYGGYSSGAGLVVDVSRISGITVNPAAGTTTVGAGVRLIDLYSGLASHGVSVPGGSCPTVGLAGLALGGGQGVVGRKYGLTSDAVLSLDTVTADATLLTANAAANSDLYWASRGGGGGNFGVVTAFTLRTHPATPLALFTLQWPSAATPTVLGSWLSWVSAGPDELWSNCLLTGGSQVARVTGVLVGSAAILSSLVGGLVSLVGSAPTLRFIGSESYFTTMMIQAGCQGLTVAQCHLPTQSPGGLLSRSSFAAKSAFVLAPLSSAGLDAASSVVSSFPISSGVAGGLAFDSWGGAINRVAPDATAFVHRSALATIQFSASSSNVATPGAVASSMSWLEEAADHLAPYVSTQAYQNYIDPNLAGWAAAYYGTNLPRLSQVKATYDPDDVFHFAQSIPMAATA